MEKIQFKTQIQAPREKVYRAMLGLDKVSTYEQWTAEFNPTSTYEGDWSKGTKMLFVGTSEDGKRGGMIGEIVEHIPHQFVSIKHYGILDGENEIIAGTEVEKWAGSLENYTFEENAGETTVTIECDAVADFAAYFQTTWPKALAKLKEIVER